MMMCSALVILRHLKGRNTHRQHQFMAAPRAIHDSCLANLGSLFAATVLVHASSSCPEMLPLSGRY